MVWWILLFSLGLGMAQNATQEETAGAFKDASKKAVYCLWLQIERWIDVRSDPAFMISNKSVRAQHKRKVKSMMAENCLKKIPEEVYSKVLAEVDYSIINETLYPYIDVDLNETTREGFDWELTETEKEASKLLHEMENKLEDTTVDEQEQIERAKKFKGLFEDPFISKCFLLVQSYAANDSKLVLSYVTENLGLNQVRQKILGMGIVSCIVEVKQYSQVNNQELNIKKIGEKIFDNSVFTNSSFSWELSKLESGFVDAVELLEKYPQIGNEESTSGEGDFSLMKSVLKFFISAIPQEVLTEINKNAPEGNVESENQDSEQKSQELKNQREQKIDL